MVEKIAPTNSIYSAKSKRLLLGFLFSTAIGLLAYRRRSLTRSGVGGAILSGTTIFGLGGWAWGLSLIYFFLSSTLLTHFRETEKARTVADKFSKGSQRDFGQAVANGGIATLFAFVYGLTMNLSLRKTLQAGFAGALATATSDTWATELGILNRHEPRLITTGRRVPAGTSGGVTLLGTGAAALGAFSLGAVFLLLQRLQKSLFSLPLIALISGMAGSFFDSFLGATVQAMYYCPHCAKETEKQTHNCGTKTRLLRGFPWLNNDSVNFAATACGALVAMGMRSLFP